MLWYTASSSSTTIPSSTASMLVYMRGACLEGFPGRAFDRSSLYPAVYRLVEVNFCSESTAAACSRKTMASCAFRREPRLHGSLSLAWRYSRSCSGVVGNLTAWFSHNHFRNLLAARTWALSVETLLPQPTRDVSPGLALSELAIGV